MLATRLVGFRKGMDGLVMLVRKQLGADPFCGTVFLLTLETGGLIEALVLRRNRRGAGGEKARGGRVSLAEAGRGALRLTATEMAVLVDGLDWWRVHVPREAIVPRLEGEIAGLSAGACRQARQERSRPLLAELDLVLRGKLALISQKSTLAVAIRYATSRWAGLTLYVDDGRVEMDSNTVERSIRPSPSPARMPCSPVPIGAAKPWAVIASLVETYKVNGVDPQAYLADVITCIVDGHPQSRLDDLLPWAYPTIPGLRAAA